MLMKPGELAAVVGELDAGLHGAIVQKVYEPYPHELWLELRQKGRSTLLCASAREGFERLAVAEQRPESPKTASGAQQLLRKRVGGKRLLAISCEGHVVSLDFPTARVTLDVAAHRLTVSPPREVPEREPADAKADFPLARELGARAGRDDSKERALQRHLKKLERTRAKVAEEAARGPLAESMKRDGELLSRNLHAVTRGAKSVTLTEYGEAGAAERTIALDPKRSPKQQAEWFFHQYKRLQRGVAIATERLKKLDAELAEAKLPEARPPKAPKARDAPSVPYREYLTAKGQRIWVGRGAKHNDALTFKVASPHHLWLHARGVPGAHVVVPLEKKQTLDQETLLDAAHLAFHHSDLRGERAGEVSYTHVRYLKKAGAPGAVTYTRETTFWLKLEPERLNRLLGA